ncbi:MAG: hypothetical protein ACUVUR_00075 [bacterium]
MQITNDDDLKQALKRLESELVITEPEIIKRVRLLMGLRMAANIGVFVILALAIFMWANPLKTPFFEAGSGRLVRQILLGVGILLLFVDYLMPVARHYKIASSDEGQLKLRLRKPQKQ